MKISTAALVSGAVVAALATGTGHATSAAPPTASGPGHPCAQPGPYPLPHGGEPVRLDPADFTTRIDHPYWPMRPGTTWRYVERGGGEVATVRVTVTRRTKVIESVRARVVHDVVRVDGEVVEDTRDWYAQDSGGSLWYLGELSRSYEDGRFVGTEGSWMHGRDGAQAGVILPAHLSAGCRYREEHLAGEAEDRARILSTRETLRTPTGLHHDVVQTANTTPLEPDVLENKFYAPGIGPVLELDLSPERGSAVLTRVTHRAP
ncbi:hypothetical protein [Nocardioides sp. Soil805]|uniref:hypothetical protein n=1 Tax=Nocardioides sp. Soil805 TaxID=1736416 RepID=UPI00070241E8|nr:hypothetical protein [Nocardioides sp. Soil805]KRF37638.1 hypothetical protein ASG94_10170 [Nocardioides sp. Soil805]